MCTAITLKTADFYFGRNLDLEYNYQEEVCITPRNYVFSFHHEASMKQHYAMIGMAYVCDHYPLYYDACNEKGLCMVSLSMEKYTYYKTYRKDMCNLTPFECIPYLLGKCANVHEVKNELQKINIVAESFSASLPLTPLHFMVSDENESIVIECVKEGMKVYDNPVGVVTNNPPFDTMLFQLNNYMHLSSKTSPNNFSKSIAFEVYSNGLGAFGLPGDNSSISRFIRATFNKYNMYLKNSEEDSVVQFFHLLDSVKQIKGCVITKDEKYEKTIYSSCINASKQIYYYKTYGNSSVSALCLHNENLDLEQLVCYPLNTTLKVQYQN